LKLFQAKKQPITWPPKPKCRPPTQIQWDKVKIERQTTTSGKKKIPRPPNAEEIARAARIQEMIDAHRQGLRRLYLGRQRAMINRRAIHSIMEKDAREYAERDEHRKQLIAELAANFKKQQRRARAWVKEIEESYENSEPFAVRMEREYQMRERNSMQVDGRFEGPELTPAKQEEDIGNPSKEVKETEECRTPFLRVLGDSKMIKMKVMNEYAVTSIFKTSPTLRRRNLKTHQSPVILDLCLTKTRAGKSHDFVTLLFVEKLRFQNVVRPHKNEKSSFLNSPGLKSAFS